MSLILCFVSIYFVIENKKVKIECEKKREMKIGNEIEKQNKKHVKSHVLKIILLIEYLLFLIYNFLINKKAYT